MPKNLTDYVTLRNDGDTKKKVNNITKENYKQLQLIASRREQKKQRKPYVLEVSL